MIQYKNNDRILVLKTTINPARALLNISIQQKGVYYETIIITNDIKFFTTRITWRRDSKRK